MKLPAFDRYATVFQWLGIISLLTFLISICLIPLLVRLLPPDYFIRHTAPARENPPHPALGLLLFLLRQTIGIILLLSGIVMLFLPGQGILTIVLGISLLSFPGKHTLIQNIIATPSVRHGLNWIRAKTKRPPFLWKKGE